MIKPFLLVTHASCLKTVNTMYKVLFTVSMLIY